ncbi:DNA-binding transcriptional regulator, LacI/PurR family [Propionibacterium cyclohexanicum]|uniref:DNA-binding transcriptional regulator, LacI/PurR family n=1 Tax=Propionibacterium cyclohexanicum TaxID=64702 RepID=A0A1H9TD54_9ACTN|nr:LacI family DNA-binding transcriptional regulator [Propionibacterium cyclohexanicum]SER94719.1 DNA-binding transcriptional regulator, LacI/PurR family [Propionibacterium cyclohexanicum]
MTPEAQRPPSIRDVAGRAGVAISSASAALNDKPGVSDETRARILSVAKDLGYVPSWRGRSLSAKRAFTVGLVVERDPDVMGDDPFFGAFVGGIEESLGPRGYALAVRVSRDARAAATGYRELAGNRRVDGVFLNELLVDDPRPESMLRWGMPAVGINPGPGEFVFPTVRQDGTKAIVEALRWLARIGHRTIAHVAGPLRYVHAVERLEAFRSVLLDLGLDPSLVTEGDFTYQGGYEAADRLLAVSPRPTAVFCANDLTAVGVMNRALDLGMKVPADLSVIGYDGIAMGGYTRPTLTTIKTSPRALGRQSARLLLDLIEGSLPMDAQASVPEARLVVRSSAGPASTI